VRIERAIDLPAPPERAYEAVMDPGRLAEWVTVHAGFKEDPPERLDEGAHLAQRLKVAHQRFTVRWTVTNADRPWRVDWEGKGPAGAHARVTYRLEPNGDETRFSYLNEYDLPGGPAGKLAGRAVARMAGREAERSLERLRSLLGG
jgi:carbon monoxide dehydrogenase subunit G